ncbi:MAG: hypothetical protein ACM3MI_09635 [Clostridiales bacterium]
MIDILGIKNASKNKSQTIVQYPSFLTFDQYLIVISLEIIITYPTKFNYAIALKLDTINRYDKLACDFPESVL